MKPCGPCARLYIASFEPSRRSTDAVASIRPSIGTRSGSLWPPTKLYLGKPPKRGDGSGSPLAKRDVRSNAALMIVSSPVGVLCQRLAWRRCGVQGEARKQGSHGDHREHTEGQGDSSTALL